MQTQERQVIERTAPRPGGRRRWLKPALVGAAAVIAAVVLAVVVLDSGDGTPDVGSSPQEVVGAWFEAFGAGDVEEYEALMSPSAVADEDFANPEVGNPPPEAFFEGGLDGVFARESKLIAATEATWSPSCTATGAVVMCTVTFDSPLGYPVGPRRLEHEFRVEDGLIVSWKVTWDISPGDPINAGLNLFDVLTEFQYGAWVQENRPADYAELFLGEEMLLNDDSQIERHRALVAEWAAQR